MGMNIKGRSCLLISIMAIISLSSILVVRGEAGGIGTPFGKVIIENLTIGKTYSTSKASNLFLTVKNKSETETGLEMKVLKPLPGKKLPEGYEPIPDTSWIRLEKYSFKVASGKEAKTDVIISIPEIKEYKGKKFVVFILSRTTQGMMRLGLESMLVLGISESDHQATLSSKGLEPDSVNFLIEPESFSASQIELNKRYELGNLDGRSLRITNMGQKEFKDLPSWIKKLLKFFRIKWNPEKGRKYTISSIPVPEYLLSEGHEPLPDPSMLKFSQEKKFWFIKQGMEYKDKICVEINGKQTKEIKGYLELNEYPETDIYKGRKFVFAIKVEAGGAKRYVRGFIEILK